MPYRISYSVKTIERDDYKDGLIGDSREWSLGYRAESPDLGTLVREAFEAHGLPLDYVFVGDSSEPITSVGASRQENDEGEAPTKAEVRQFKAGRRKLWLADYRFEIEYYESRGITLDELKAAMPGAQIDA